MYMPEIGERIKQLRRQRDISQMEQARHLGVSKSVVSSHENVKGLTEAQVEAVTRIVDELRALNRGRQLDKQ